RKLYVGIMSFFAVVFTISILFLPFYNPIYFYLQHVSLFLFMAMFIYYLLKLGYDRLEKRIYKKTALKGYTITIFVALLFLFSNVQLYAIETYQTSGFQACSYYDEYNNSIYYTQLSNQCPELEVLAKTDNELVFRVYESISGKSEPGYMISNNTSYNLDAKLRIDIMIQYFLDGSIQSVDTKKSTNILLHSDDENYKVYNSFHTYIENFRYFDTLSESINQFTTKMTVQVLEDHFYDYDNYENVNHYTGDEFLASYVGYQSTRQDYYLSQSNQEVFQIVAQKIVYDDSTFTNGQSEILRVYDASCYDEYCSIQEGMTDGTLQSVDPIEYYNDIYAYVSYYKAGGITYDYQTYHYQDGEDERRYVTYSTFEDYPLVFSSEHTSYENLLNPGIERNSFNYRGRTYMEHGDFYSIFNQTVYGTKMITKDSTMGRDNTRISNYASDFVTSEYSSVDEVGTFNNFYDALYINDYGSTLATRFRAESYEILYQKNPLIFDLLIFNE
ncbi:MAG: hypothetical protein K9L64_05220, partial [Candidatus Izimaplasma sp.]|nr:hypothetical protein [Candidatus Izimaplasma bacterium]